MAWEIFEKYMSDILSMILGQNFIVILSVGLLSLLMGFIFLTYRFVILRKNDKDWRGVNTWEKMIISVFMGFLIVMNSSVSNLILMIPFVFLEIQPPEYFSGNKSLFLFAVLYSFYLLYLKKRERDCFKEIEDYFLTAGRDFMYLSGIFLVVASIIMPFIDAIFSIILGAALVIGISRYVRKNREILEKRRRKSPKK